MSDKAKGIIHAYGLFWRCDEVEWFPGKGVRPNGGGFRLLGRIGANRGSIRVADFADQRGIYILHGNYGAYYVGLTISQKLGKRLKQHMSDDHCDQWDRFSWFGFKQVLGRKDDDGVCGLRAVPQLNSLQVTSIISDLEALLIKALSPAGNINQPRFKNAEEWAQIKQHEAQDMLAKT